MDLTRVNTWPCATGLCIRLHGAPSRRASQAGELTYLLRPLAPAQSIPIRVGLPSLAALIRVDHERPVKGDLLLRAVLFADGVGESAYASQDAGRVEGGTQLVTLLAQVKRP